MPRILLGVLLILFLNALPTAAQQRFSAGGDTAAFSQRAMVLPQNFYNQHLGFFCKKEDLIQKKMGLPIYFRLGSKNYVDYLERKGNAVKGF